MISFLYGRKRHRGGGGDLTAVAGVSSSLRAVTGQSCRTVLRGCISQRGVCVRLHPPPLRGHLSVSNQAIRIKPSRNRKHFKKKMSYVICPRSRNIIHRTQGLLATPRLKMCLGEGHNRIKALLPHCESEETYLELQAKVGRNGQSHLV